MGLLDGLVKDALGSALGNMLGGNNNTAPAQAGGQPPAGGGLQGLQLAQLALQLLQQVGGLQGLLNLFNKAGLADQVKSWISTGGNQGVSPQQLSQAIGPNILEQLGGQFGLNADQVSSGLAQVLPNVVDQLTPSGEVPDNHHDLVSDGLKLLMSKLG
jgi:uncharacterized protein YidB (DUF937 family)